MPPPPPPEEEGVVEEDGSLFRRKSGGWRVKERGGNIERGKGKENGKEREGNQDEDMTAHLGRALDRKKIIERKPEGQHKRLVDPFPTTKRHENETG